MKLYFSDQSNNDINLLKYLLEVLGIGILPASHYASMKLVGKAHQHFAASCWARAVAGLRGETKNLNARGGTKNLNAVFYLKSSQCYDMEKAFNLQMIIFIK